jgi:hypothetical protein
MVEAAADRAHPLAALFSGCGWPLCVCHMPDDLELISRVLIGWDIGVAA